MDIARGIAAAAVIVPILLVTGCASSQADRSTSDILLFRDPATGQIFSCAPGDDCGRYRGFACVAELHSQIGKPSAFAVSRCEP